MTYYACVETMIIADLPFPPGSSSMSDIHIQDVPDQIDGKYREITPTFLKWITSAISSVKAKGKKTSAMEQFYGDCIDVTGLSPLPSPAPYGYGPPCSGPHLTLTKTLDIWENIMLKEESAKFVMGLCENPESETPVDPDTGYRNNTSRPSSYVEDFKVKCPHCMPLVRGPGRKAEHVRAVTSNNEPAIPQWATEYHGMAGNWFPILEHWKEQPKKSRGVASISPAVAIRELQESSVPLSANNPLSDLFD